MPNTRCILHDLRRMAGVVAVTGVQAAMVAWRDSGGSEKLAARRDIAADPIERDLLTAVVNWVASGRYPYEYTQHVRKFSSRPALTLPDAAQRRADGERLTRVIDQLLEIAPREAGCVDCGSGDAERRADCADPPTVRHAAAHVPHPGEDAKIAYRLHVDVGMKQAEVAAQMSRELKRPFGQGAVSRLIAKYRAYLSACGVDADAKTHPAKLVSVDPARLDLGQRTDGK